MASLNRDARRRMARVPTSRPRSGAVPAADHDQGLDCCLFCRTTERVYMWRATLVTDSEHYFLACRGCAQRLVDRAVTGKSSLASVELALWDAQYGGAT